MKQIITLFLSLFLIIGATSAQKTIRDANAQKRDVTNFHSIQVAHGIDVFLTQSTEESVAVSASEETYRDNIVTEVRQGILFITYGNEEKNWWKGSWKNRKLKAYVSIKTLKQIVASGGSDILIEDQISATDLVIRISGGSDLKGDFSCNEMKLTASGGSDANIKGRVTRLSISASGGSDVNGYDLISDYCNVKSSGGSDVNVTANKGIDASASGGSDIHYKGNPIETKTSKSGSSDITKVR